MVKQSGANGFTGSGDRADGTNVGLNGMVKVRLIKVQFEQRLEVCVAVCQIVIWSKSIYTQGRGGAYS